MKRPQGFDGAGRPTMPGATRKAQTASAVPGPAGGAGKGARTVQVPSRDTGGEPITAPIALPTPEADAETRDEAPTTDTERHGVRSRHDEPRRAGPRSVRALFRAAQRERKRYERREMRRFTRRTRRRRMLLLGGLGAVAVTVLASILISISPLMALRTIEVTGTHRLKSAQIRHAISGQLGRPLPLVDTSAIRSELADFPLIRSYSLVSEPPSTLVVRVVERVPVGAVTTGGGYAVVDAAGVTITTGKKKPSDYPVIDASVDSPGFTAAVAVLQALPSATLATVASVTASTTDDVTFTLRDGGAEVRWGDRSQSALKAAILTSLLKAAPHASLYDVSSPRDVVTR